MPENNSTSKEEMESVMLLKQKVCKTHELIMMYSKNLQENYRVKSDLATGKKETNRVIYDYKSALDKIKELELKITQAKRINEELTNKMNDNDMENTANKQVIEQLTYKIEELEKNHSDKIMEYELNKSAFEERIKDLEQEFKKSEKQEFKKSQKLKRMGKKEREAVTNDTNTSKHDIETETQSTFNLDIDVSLCDDKLHHPPTVETQDKSIMTDDLAFESTSRIGIQSTSDIGVNTSLCELNVQSKCETQDKNIMTDEFYNTANDPFPLFCTKCRVHLQMDLIPEEIYKTMSTYPKLIERDLISPPEEDSLLPYSSSDTSSDLMNKDVASPKALGMSRASSSDHCDNSIIISQAAHSTMIQSSKNVDSKDTNTTAYVPAAKNLPSNLSLISATINLPEDTNCTRENFHSDSNDSLIKQSSSIKKMKKQLKVLESKVKQLPKLKRMAKRNISSCHHCEYSNGTRLNPDLITAICKGVVQYCNGDKVRDEGKKLRRDRKKRGIKKKEKRKLIKRKLLKRYNACEDSWETEPLDEDSSPNVLCNRFDDAARENKASQFEHSIPYATMQNINRNNSLSVLDVNTSDRSLDNESDKESNLCTREKQESVPHLMEGTSAIHGSMTSDVIINEISTNDNSLREDDTNYIDLDNQMASKIATVLLSNSQKSVDHANSKIITTENGPKRESKIKRSIANRLLKKIKNLKKKTQANSHVNDVSCIDTSEHHELTKSRIAGQRIGNHPVPLKSIIDLKRKSEASADLSINMQGNSESHSDYHEPIKKKRIAYVPKSSVLQSSNIQNDLAHHTQKIAALLETSQQKRDGSKQLDRQIQQNSARGSSIENEKNHTVKKSTVECNKMPRIDNKPDEENSNNEDLNDDNFSPPNMDVEQASVTVEFDKCDDAAVDSIIDENTNASASAEPSLANAKIIAEVSNSLDKLHVSFNDISHNEMNDLEGGRPNVPSTNIQLESPSSPSEDSIHDGNEDFEENIQIKQIGIVEEVTPTDQLKQTRHTNAEQNYAIPCNTVLNDNGLSNVSPHENHDSKCMSPRNRSPGISRDNLGNRVIEHHVAKIPRENVCTNQRGEATKCTNVPYNNVEESRTLISWVIEYINEKPIKPKISHKQMTYISTITDNFVKKELQKLADSPWECTVYLEVLQNLTSTCGSRIIAKCIIEFLSENKNKNVLDKSFTPPAPLMTTLEQKLTTLLIDLQVSRPTIIHFVQAGIQYKLFRLNSDLQNLNVVDTLTRMYVTLSRIQKDREKIRIMCCDALYCMNLKAISVLYIALTSWSEVLPKAHTNTEILPKCIAFLVGWQQINKQQTTANRSKALKLLIVAYYEYVYSQETINDLLKEFAIALKVNQTDGLDTAIILIAKKQGPSWIYKNFICSTLLPMIINHQHPCAYDGFCLLGRMLRAFPSTVKTVQDIIIQLHDLIKSDQGSHDQQEGVISALLSLSKQKFDVVASCVLQWTPSTPLRPSTIMQLEAFIRLRKKAFWKSYLKIYKSVKNKK